MTEPVAGGTRERRPRRGRWLLARAARVVVVLVAVVLGAAGTASAHSALERSDPPEGGMVAVGRTELTLWFGEAVTASGSAFSVQGADPASAPVPTRVSLDEGATVVRLITPPLQRGAYTISWSVVAEDGHPAQGTVSFGAGLRAAGVTADEGPSPDPWPVALRFLDLGGTLLALGALVVSGRVLAALGAAGGRLRRRVLALGAIGVGVSFLAALATPVVAARIGMGPDTSLADWVPEGLQGLADSTWGTLWTLRLVALAVATGALWRARQRAGPADTNPVQRSPLDRDRMPSASAAMVAGAELVAAAGLGAWAGHAATLPARSAVAALAATLHVLAAGVWAGGLVVLVVAALPVLRLDGPTRASSAAEAWRAYSPLAAVSAGVLVSTGIYEAGRHVGTMGALTSIPYGRAIVAKGVLVAMALAVAGHTTLVVHPRLADRVLAPRTSWRPHPRRLATTVTIEAVVLVVAVAVAALMTSVPTAREVAATDAATAPVSRTVDGVFVTFESVPSASLQHVIVRTEGVVRPMPAQVTGVDVGVAEARRVVEAPPALVPLRELETGRYEGVVMPGIDGDWTARVVLHRLGRPDTELLVPWESGAAAGPSRVELVATALAALLLTGLGGGVVVVRRRRTAGQGWAPGLGGPGGVAASGSGVEPVPVSVPVLGPEQEPEPETVQDSGIRERWKVGQS